MSQPMIQVNNLAKRYARGQQDSLQTSLYETLSNLFSRKTSESNTKRKSSTFWALKDINFEVYPGESLGIIGHNGAGKSTLLKILSRVVHPTTGQIRLSGRVASLLEVGTGFHPELTGLENIYLNGTILGMTRQEVKAKLNDIIEFSGVADALNTPVKRYSSGMRVRLAFAVAAHLDPEILIIDEVLAVGDMEFQQKCLGKMQEATHENNRTVIFVSHNLPAVQTLCDRCIWIDNGKIQMIDETTKVIDQYLNTTSNADKTDTSNTKRNSSRLGQNIRIEKIQPTPSHHSGFYLNQPISMQITLSSKKQFSNLRFGVSIKDLSGGSVLTALTPTNTTIHTNSTSTHTVKLNAPNLAPGSYAIALSVGHGSIHEPRINFDIVTDGPSFKVLPLAKDGQTLYNWQREYGHTVNFNATSEPCNQQKNLAA